MWQFGQEVGEVGYRIQHIYTVNRWIQVVKITAEDPSQSIYANLIHEYSNLTTINA